jgi:16S rRNA processing protein RimM
LPETTDSEYVTIARIRKVWGRRGELAAEIHTDFPERFEPGAEVVVFDGRARETRTLEGVWFHKGLANLKFAGVDSISAAEALVGGEIQIPLASRKTLGPGEVYLSDLVGCAVIEVGPAGEEMLGTVESIQDAGATRLLNVLTPEGELLIPFAQEICRKVDVGAKRIEVRLPEGLRELNRGHK